MKQEPHAQKTINDMVHTRYLVNIFHQGRNFRSFQVDYKTSYTASISYKLLIPFVVSKVASCIVSLSFLKKHCNKRIVQNSYRDSSLRNSRH